MPNEANVLTRERVREALTEGADWCDLLSNEAVDLGAMLRDLLAALDDPARWCAVVGDVAVQQSETLRLVGAGDLIVTPHQEGA